MSNPASIMLRRLVDDISSAFQEEVNFFLKWGLLGSAQETKIKVR